MTTWGQVLTIHSQRCAVDSEPVTAGCELLRPDPRCARPGFAVRTFTLIVAIAAMIAMVAICIIVFNDMTQLFWSTG